MPLWTRYAIALVFFLVIGMVGIWAIREGGSFAFLRPPRRPPGVRGPADEGRGPTPGP